MDTRYDRQIGLIGEEGQSKLSKARVLIIGAGGLGNICAKFLASSGVGELLIVDHDIVEKSNLNRQIMFNKKSIGKNKAESLYKTLQKINPEVRVSYADSKIQNYIKEFFQGYNVIMDCTDNMETSYYIEKMALKFETPLVFAKTSKYFGVVTVLRDKPYLKENYPTKQLNKDNSVFPPIGGVLGSLQAGFALKLLLGMEVDDDVVHYDFLNNVMTKYEKGGSAK